MTKKTTQNNENKGGDSVKKQNASGPTTVVLKMDMNCEGCACKVIKAVRTIEGVESVTIGDNKLNKLTVVGKLDPIKLRQKVEEKMKKKVELIFPIIKKTAPESEQKPKDAGKKDQKKAKELPVTTVVLKLHLDCQGCVRRIHKLISKTKGYIEMSVDKNKDLVTVKGAIDMKLLAEALQRKLKRAVEVVPLKKGNGDSEKKGGGSGGGDKKDGSGGANYKEGKAGGGGGDKGKNGGGGVKTELYKKENHDGSMAYVYPRYGYGSGYADYVHAPQLFSDENPNACVVM